MLKPICVPCCRFFRPKKNGVEFVEGMPASYPAAAPGNAEPDKWKPYKLWMGDLWRCEGCGTEIISGVGLQPIAYQHDENFKSKTKEATIQINDC